MASTATLQSFSSPIYYSSSSRLYNCQFGRTLALSSSQLRPSISVLKSNKQFLVPIIQTKRLNSRRIYAAQSNFVRVIRTIYKVGKDGTEAGSSLVPDSIPRPIARISVAGVGAMVALFLLKSILSTAFFVLAMMGLIYSAFIALNKDEGPKGGGGTTTSTTSPDDSLEEARRIMEKYK